jgi:NADH pyrophosphatase NudC (nudix superfamily)
MKPARDTFCGYCGVAFEPPLVDPRRCRACSTQIWANPIPVSVVIVPIVRGIRTGVLVIRRGIEPGKGKLALVGGFLEEHETWA